MQVKRDLLSPTRLKLTISADKGLLNKLKTSVITELGQNLKIQGFRPGKAPLSVLEKNLDPNTLQSTFLDEALNHCYSQTVEHEKLRPVAQPEVSVLKFVPFETLEFTAEVEIVGDIKLADYKAFKLTKEKVDISAKEVNDVIANLAQRAAAKTAVSRAAKDGDEVTIDFSGTDTETKEPIAGADGIAYPLVLGSNAFIPGFEANVVGMKPGETKEFKITFPKDYGVSALQSRKVTFKVKATEINELKLPKLDDAFAKTLGLETLAALKTDAKKQLQTEKEAQNQRTYENDLLKKVADASTVAVPESLVETDIDRLEEEEKRNLAYRGQTWQEHLKEEGVNEQQHRERQREAATNRVKTGLVLAELATVEKIEVTKEELDLQLELLKAQYPDPNMRSELDKPEARREIASRLVTEKTIAKLVGYASKS